ncbi:hypothetical protein IFM89_024186 [Coptis chinensis]|uniref:Uncharacterized protein n=1 Tax=Coptis chinensis TaxID=261450 RepID=A0A835LVA2_9MAGN|nr:hypothetical protein IFM89_024186 [Coptis chinensis]
MEEKREIMWCSHENFKAMVKENWQVPIEGNPFFILIQKLKRLKKALKTWNKETFGHLPTNIKVETIKRSKALIRELQDENGNLMTDQKEISEYLVKHYTGKFKRDELYMDEELIQNVPEMITEEENE